jgi:glyoxylase-like metal-dependent hydrolase (beta-lactamase superfamily II)
VRSRLAACAAGLLAAIAGAARADIPEKPYEIVTLAEGVYGFVWSDPMQDLIESNALFIVNDRDVVVVDTGGYPSTARRMLAALRQLTDKPVRYVVNTHWHDDHHWGNAVYRDAFPGVEFVAHRDTRTDILGQSYASREHDIALFDERTATLERWLRDGKDDTGKPLNDARRARARELIALDQAAVPEVRAVREAPPDLTFDDHLVLHRGDRTIELRFLGRGNTRGDVVVLLPKERIVATGDLLVSPIPFAFGSYYAEWADTLHALDGLPADTLFFLHGKPQRDRTYLRQVEGLLRALVAQCSAAVASGLSLEAAKQKITLADWKAKFAGTDEMKGRAFFVAPAVTRAFRQARGEAAAFGPEADR